MRRLLAVLALPLLLAACGVEVGAPMAEVQRRAYIHDGPPTLTLYTVVRNLDGRGAHSGLLIDGPQRVLFDPAGSFRHPHVPERGDVLHGFTPRIEDVYVDFHARESFRVIEQTVEVSPEVAAQALTLAQKNGPVAPARCALSITSLLRQLPGFEHVGTTWFPNGAARAFGEHPGVTRRVITDDDADDNHGVIIRERDALAAAGLL